MNKRRTVVGIPASYDEAQNLETESTKYYLNYLSEKNVNTVMTTAGTSHFNLLSVKEVHELNRCVVKNFSGKKIIGIPALSLKHALKFVEEANYYIDTDTSLMALYPERFYDHETLINYMMKIRNSTENKIYIHGKTIRKATGGTWDYNYQVLNDLYDLNALEGIKEENSNFYASYDLISNLNGSIDVIVAGGSMRRFEFLETAGADTFLSGIGNFFPEIEQRYLDGDREYAIELEKKFFSVFMKFGWHKSLRIGLDILDLTCFNNREPWPKILDYEHKEIERILEVIKNEK